MVYINFSLFTVSDSSLKLNVEALVLQHKKDLPEITDPNKKAHEYSKSTTSEQNMKKIKTYKKLFTLSLTSTLNLKKKKKNNF